MKRYLLDTNTTGALISKRGTVPARVQAARRSGGRIGIGIPVLAELYQVIDILIAATAIVLGDCTVVSDDTDLLAVPGLNVETWGV
jgi:predicted nucleic acid-binding protein